MADLGAIGSFLPKIDFGGLFSKIQSFVIFILIIIGVAGAVYIYFRNQNKKARGADKEIHWWEDVNGRLVPMRIEQAEEISIPGTNLKLFYVKSTNTWLPRFTRGVAPNVFFVGITPQKEIVNFTLKSLESQMAKSGLQYDHTDMRWAAENIREFVKRNYKDKATPWWREYKDVIAIAIYIVVMTASLVTIIYFLRGVVNDIGAIANAVSGAVERLNMCAPTASGLIQGGASG